VEVILAMTVMLISSAGVMSMQKAAVQGNLDARRLDVANSIAQTWLDRLATDAATWNSATGLTQTTWLNTVLGHGFVMPATAPAASAIYSPAFDIFGRDVTNLADGSIVFCTHVKVDTVANFATPTGGATTEPVLLRATVLVFWPKNLLNAQGAPSNPLCPGPNDVAATEAGAPGTYHLLYATEALRRGS
jgi:Tfp pilus assembly protein PilV